nr:hypothetical protein B0A51_13878 [Rachicladosporium sp. CCFEE 5018]
MKTTTSLLLAATAALTSAVATPARIEARASGTSSTLPTVTVKGNAFFAGDQRFYIRGIDYQPGGSSGAAGSDGASDPIANVENCKRDIVEFKKLGINTVRVYTVDNTLNHDECMSALANAGIYLALDVNTPKYSIRRDKPAQSYNAVYLQSLFATVDAFQGYSNTLLFFSGNEVINDDTSTPCAPYVKAVTRDLKQYIGSRGYRKIPVGYSAADVESNRYEMADYMNCGTDDQRSDFYAFNDYSWCDPSTYEVAWQPKVEKFGNYSIPLFLSEFGCIKGTRTFDGQIAALMSSQMTSVYSGGLAYEYSEEGSGYGLVTLSGSSVSEGSSFTALQSQFSSNPAPQGDGGYKMSSAASECPAQSSTWEVTDFSGEALPAIPDGAQDYMKNGAGTGPGLAGSGSQDAGGQSTATASAGSGSVTAVASGSAASATQSGAAGSLRAGGEMGTAPWVCAAVVVMSTMFGAALL